MEQNQQVLAALSKAESLLGVKWVHQGRNSKHGLDCVGFVAEFGKAAGLDLTGLPSDYARLPHADLLLSNIQKYCYEVEIKDIIPGDILVMKWKDTAQHVAIYLGNDWFIHSYEKQGVTKQQLIPFWRNRITNVFRIIQAA